MGSFLFWILHPWRLACDGCAFKYCSVIRRRISRHDGAVAPASFPGRGVCGFSPDLCPLRAARLRQSPVKVDESPFLPTYSSLGLVSYTESVLILYWQGGVGYRSSNLGSEAATLQFGFLPLTDQLSRALLVLPSPTSEKTPVCTPCLSL